MRIGLVLPGLSSGMLEGLNLPALRRVLRRARRMPRDGKGYARTVCRLGGFAETAPPVAALTALLDFPDDHSGHWLRADPVYLHADLNDVRLFAVGDFDPGDLRPQFERLAAYFKRENCELLSSPDGTRWYLRFESAPKIITVPLDEVAGASIAGALPTGKDQTYWRRIMTETQMLLHDAALSGPRVNAIWLWGEGDMPVTQTPEWDAFGGDDALLAAIARRQGGDCTASVAAARLTKATLIVDHGLQTVDGDEGLAERLRTLETTYFRPLFEHVRRGATLELVIDDGVYELTRGRSWRVWQ